MCNIINSPYQCQCYNIIFYIITVDCGSPQTPTNGKLKDYVKGHNVTFQCDDEYFPSTTMIAFCIGRVWNPSPEEFKCTKNESR